MTSSMVLFSHVQLYVDYVEDVSVYKEFEGKLNRFSSQQLDARDSGKDFWKAITNKDSSFTDTLFQPQRRDVIKQLLAGFGFRVTGVRMPSPTVQTNTRTVLVTSKDPNGVQIIVTSLSSDPTCEKDQVHYFDAENIHRFYNAHANRQGFAVLAFEVTSVEEIHQKYTLKHPKLVLRHCDYGEVKVLEVYAYYQGDTCDSNADEGTVLRFVEGRDYNSAPQSMCCGLPGLTPVEATFDNFSQAAYSDHWVSNVNNRVSFLKTLEDTLGFLPKVDFNAGVVAAGEAQIESTVTGNESTLSTNDKDRALRDQSQVYLPINNSLSDVGHVHGFLKEIGQGVQHVASRVENLTEFVQRANDYREMIGEGFTFLRIPRSYYGILSKKQLIEPQTDVVPDKKTPETYNYAALSEECAEAILDACERCGIISADFAVDLYMSAEEIDHLLESKLTGCFLEEYQAVKEDVVAIILRSRYANLYSLLRDNLSEKSYLGIVRNQILVDVQGEDLLYQIFTSNILQRNVGEEAPFFEFIQRVCSECKDEKGCPVKIKPGCGGFGIRNFLTLFLSIEVSKAMMDVLQAKSDKDEAKQTYAQQMVDCFTNQLNESNPILTEISDAMTAEGNCRNYMQKAMEENGDSAKISYWKSKMEAAANTKRLGNAKLMECNAKYEATMKSIRERSMMDE